MARKYAVLVEVDQHLEKVTGVSTPKRISIIFTDPEEKNLVFYLYQDNVTDEETAYEIVEALNTRVEARERTNSDDGPY